MTSKEKRGFRQAHSNAISEFCCGRLGKGHDQNLRWHQAICFNTMAQHKPNVQSGQGPSFAGAGTGLNQLNTLQGHAQHIQLLRGQWRVGCCHGAPSPMVAT